MLEEQYVYFLVLSGVVGLIIGSFLNVVALRLLAEKSFVRGNSRCPKCENPIAWYDNIPVLSYILLRGKCRKCSGKISLQYPVVELITGGFFVAAVATFGLTLKTLFLLVLICNLIVITITDIREKYIYDINSVPLIPLGLLYNFFDLGNNATSAIKYLGINFYDVFIAAILGAILGAVFFEVFSRVGLLLAGEYAFGTGDSILAAALGAWFGWKLMIVILILSFLVQLVVGIPVILYNMVKDKDYQSLIAMFMMFFALGITFAARFFMGMVPPFVIIGAIILAFIMVGIAVFVILKRTRERQSYTFLPFGPALVLGGLAVMFLQEYFLNSFLQY